MRKLFIVIALLLLIPVVHASGLAFKDMAVEVDGDTDDNVDVDGGSFEAAPGDSIELTIEIENDYASSTEDHKIKHVDVSIDVENFCSKNLDDDIQEEIRINDLSPGVDDEAVFHFSIPDCANEGNYDLDITVDGKDEDGTEYSIEQSLTVGIDKVASSMVMDFSLDSGMTCDDRTITVSVEAHNLGSVDEDAGLLIINNDLGINKFEFMDLRTGKWTDEDTQFLKSYTFTIDDDVEAEEYDLRAEIEYAANSKELKKWLTITVLDCVEPEEEISEIIIEEDEEITEEDSSETTDESSQEDFGETAIVIPPSEEKELFSLPLLIGALLIGIIVLIIMIIMLKKQNNLF